MAIKNLPEYASDYNFVVARNVDDELWFYGAYNDYVQAHRIAVELGKAVVLYSGSDTDAN